MRPHGPRPAAGDAAATSLGLTPNPSVTRTSSSALKCLSQTTCLRKFAGLGEPRFDRPGRCGAGFGKDRASFVTTALTFRSPPRWHATLTPCPRGPPEKPVSMVGAKVVGETIEITHKTACQPSARRNTKAQPFVEPGKAQPFVEPPPSKAQQLGASGFRRDQARFVTSARSGLEAREYGRGEDREGIAEKRRS